MTLGSAVSDFNTRSRNNDNKMAGKSNDDGAVLLPAEIAALRKELQCDRTARSAPNSRSCSFKGRPRSKGLRLQIEEPRRNSLPVTDNLSVSFTDIRTVSQIPFQRVRSFKVTSKGIENRGDSLRRKSNTSIASTGSSSRCERAKSFERRERFPSNTSEYSAGCSSCTSAGQGYYRVLVLGDDGVGKSALTNQFMTSEYMGNIDITTDTDQEDEDITVSVLLDGEESTLEFVDTAEPWMDSVCRQNVDAFLVVYSVDSRPSFDAAADMVHYLRQNQGTDRPVILVANKIDLVRKKLVKGEDARKLAEDYSCKFCEISVTINHHVDELLVGILRQIRLKLNPENMENIDCTNVNTCTETKHLKGAKNILSKIFRKSQKLKTSCDNLFDL